MADTKGTDSKPSETRSTAVKPPVLDLTARQAGAESGSKADPKPDTKTETKPAGERPRPSTRVEPEGPGFAFGAALTGGIIGLAAAYGLAWFGLWPAAPVTPAAADPRMAKFATAIPELETVTQTSQAELATLNQRIVALESAPATAAPAAATAAVDLSAVETEIAALGQRIETLASAPAPTADISGLSAELAGLAAQIQELGARIGTAEAGLRTLDTTMTETTAALADQPGDIGAVLQLPLILSGFETAFATGRPYEAELSALRAASADASIPTAIANAAPTGLTRPDLIAQRFEAVLPAMLAGRPANPDAQWQDGAVDWFRSMIALRPTGEIAGDTPEALMSQLESAMARRDFAAAQTLFVALPEPMISAAEEVPALVAAQAEAALFLETLRNEALNGGAGQ